MGRPRIKIDWEVLKGYASFAATAEDICKITGIPLTTLERRCLEEYSITFGAFIKKHSNEFVLSNRMQLVKQSKNGNTTASIYLDKSFGGSMDEFQKQSLSLRREELELKKKISETLEDIKDYNEISDEELKAIINETKYLKNVTVDGLCITPNAKSEFVIFEAKAVPFSIPIALSRPRISGLKASAGSWSITARTSS